MPAKPAAKKGKGKAVISASTSFNPLDQTCIHPESYHVAQRYRTHKCNMYFQKSSCSPWDPHLSVFVIFTFNGFYSYIQYIWQLGAPLEKIGWACAYSPHVKMICPYPPDPSMFELRWGSFWHSFPWCWLYRSEDSCTDMGHKICLWFFWLCECDSFTHPY